MEEPSIGEALGRYRVVRKLGEGGMGAVFLAEDSRLERLIALKILSPETAADPVRLGRFKREARIAAGLQHPNIVTIHDVGETAGRHYIAMEFLDGVPLDHLLARSSLTLERCLRLGLQVAEALRAAHEAGITHRDLKPGNVIVESGDRIKVLDFGLAKDAGIGGRPGAGSSSLSPTTPGTLLGTFPYMSPEQARGEPIDHRSDLFSLGALLYEMVTGERPFSGGAAAEILVSILRDDPLPADELRSETPASLVSLIARCLDKSPGRRFPSAAEVVAELEQIAASIADGEPEESGDSPRPERPLLVSVPESTLPETWSVPHRRNPNFTGRESVLAEVRERFRSPGATVAIIGLGGVGKTQVALEFAHRFAADYSLVWWIQADDPAALKNGLAALGQRLGLPSHNQLDETVRQVRRWLARNPGWLLVFDDAPDPDAIEPYLPEGGGGYVLATSRNPTWRRLAWPIELDVWRPEEAHRFLRRRSGRDDAESAEALAEALGHLPLALEQAAAFVEARGMELASYLELFHHHRLRLLAEGGDESTASVVTTWNLSFARVEATSRPAIQLLYLFSVMAPEDIPLELLRLDDVETTGLPDVGWGDELELERALSVLLRFSLVRRSGSSVSVHRLVQSVVREDLAGDAPVWAETAVTILARRFPDEAHADVNRWPDCARLLPHALAALAGIEGEPAGPTAELSDRVGTYLLGRAQFDEARVHLEKALRIDERQHGPDDPKVAERVNSLGRLLVCTGELHEARRSFERALRIDRAALDEGAPRIGGRLANLGMVLLELDQPEAAREPLEQSLEIATRSQSDDLALMAGRHTNVGIMRSKLGDFAAARASFDTALELMQRSYGPEHPLVANAIANVACLMTDIGEYEAARAGFRRALTIAETSLGPDHPFVGRQLVNLGEELDRCGDLEAAEDCLQRGLAIEIDAYGEEHPAVAVALVELGKLARKRGEPAAARQYLERANRIRESVLGPGHALTREARELLSSLAD